MAIFSGRSPMSFELSSIGKKQMRISGVNPLLGFRFSKCRISSLHMSRWLPAFAEKVADISMVNPSRSQGQPLSNSKAIEKKVIKKVGNKEHHLWQKRDLAGSGQKALNLDRIVSGLPNEKEAVYGALDKWTAWETEFPLIAASKALRMLRKRSRWIRVIQAFSKNLTGLELEDWGALGEATKDLNLLPPLAVLGREHTIATPRSCQAVHISGRQKVTARL